uniref:Uncharacterized protein n=1 Tax=Peronospora matthiolae TaxID=2874970 RepID=A0AAV1V5T9_9STRA
MCDRLRTGIDDNPGAVLDEHKRADAIFLRQMFHELKNADLAKERVLTEKYHMATSAHASTGTAGSSAALLRAPMALKVHREFIAARSAAAKFDKDISEGETGSSYFFRAPSTVNFAVSIPSVSLPDGSSTTDPDEMAAIHRGYWGNLYRSPSRDILPTLPLSPFQPLELLRLLRYTTSSVPAASRLHLEAPMTANDFYWAIRSSFKGRSIGLDGLPVEYYQLNPHSWARIFELVYANQFRLGRIVDGMARE